MHPLLRAAADLDSLLDLMPQFTGAMDDAATLVGDALVAGHKLLVCGNGGSASDGAHFAGEFVGRFLGERRGYPAICLASEGGVLTCIGNDYEFNEIYARQVRAFGKPGDVLVVFTSSGNSQNILDALDQANTMEIRSIAFLGKDGGRARGRATTEFIVPSPVTARIQEVHKLLLHVLCTMVEEVLPKD